MTRGSILIGGIGIALLNAMLRPVIAGNWHPNYLILGVLACAVWQIYSTRSGRVCRRSDVVSIFLLLLALLVPSSQWAWVSLGSYCCWHVYGGSWPKPMRLGLMVMVAAAFREPAGHIIKEWLAEDLLQFDTALVQVLLKLQGAEVTQSGNILRLSGDHSLVVLTGCGSFTNISVALLVWYAVCLLYSGGWQNRFVWSAVAVGMATLFVNVVRLALLAQGTAWFAFFHDGAGVWFIQTVSFAAIAVPIWVQLKHEKTAFGRGSSLPGDDRINVKGCQSGADQCS